MSNHLWFLRESFEADKGDLLEWLVTLSGYEGFLCHAKEAVVFSPLPRS